MHANTSSIAHVAHSTHPGLGGSARAAGAGVLDPYSGNCWRRNLERPTPPTSTPSPPLPSPSPPPPAVEAATAACRRCRRHCTANSST
eukprot:scaffold29823_cov89-Phaeocystis_antarctica.AAC.3